MEEYYLCKKKDFCSVRLDSNHFVRIYNFLYSYEKGKIYKIKQFPYNRTHHSIVMNDLRDSYFKEAFITVNDFKNNFYTGKYLLIEKSYV